MRNSNIILYVAIALMVIGLAILLAGRSPRVGVKEKPTPTPKAKSSPTPTPTAPAFFRGFTSPATERPQPTAGQSAQPAAQQTQFQEIHNDGTSTQQQSPQPTNSPQPTPICVLGICL